MRRMVVVGGGAAGMSAASVAKRRDPELDVTVLEGGGHASFAACGIPYWVGGIVEGEADRLVVRSPAEAAKRGVTVLLHHRVSRVDADAGQVHVDAPDGPATFPYDSLVLALGADASSTLPGADLDGVFTVRHLDDGVALRGSIAANEPRRAVVVGGGYVGLEMTEGLLELGLETTLVHSHETLLTDLVDPDLGILVNEAVEAAGADLLAPARAKAVEGREHAEAVVAGADRIPADVVVLGLGVRPRTALAEALGCALDDTGAIAVDDHGCTNLPDVYACGDCVSYPNRLTGRRAFQPLALHANRMGRLVGENVAGGDARFPGVLGTAVTRFRDLEIAATGLSEAQAQAAGYDAAARAITAETRSQYFPGTASIRVKMTVDRASDRILGAQIVGGPGSGKRIDTVAAAIWMEASAADLEAMDLAYTPPVSPTWDPVAIAARVAGGA